MTARAFLDSSVIVALIAGEADWERHAMRLRDASHRYTSPVVLLETVMVLTSMNRADAEAARSLLNDFLAEHDVRVVAIDAAVAAGAMDAFARYGKGRHPARLNLGDCFSYACAREHRLALLYKGDDFAQTDLA